MTNRKTNIGEVMGMDELRVTLSDQIRGLQRGDVTPGIANAITNTSGKLLSTVKLEMDYCKLVGKTPNIPLLLGSGS